MKMTKDVFVHIFSVHMEKDAEDGQENDTIEVIVPGTYYLKNGKHYILYEEVEENGKVTKNQLKVFEDGHVEIRKSGVLNAHMIFETGRKHFSSYQTPFGQIQVAMNTGVVKVAERLQDFVVEIDYELEVNREPLTDCRIEIRVTPRQSRAK